MRRLVWGNALVSLGLCLCLLAMVNFLALLGWSLDDRTQVIPREELVRSLGLEDRGVKQAGFYVMLGTEAAMPSVLVELGFISNPREERLLRTSAFRRRAALALFRAIRTFKEEQERALALQGVGG